MLSRDVEVLSYCLSGGSGVSIWRWRECSRRSHVIRWVIESSSAAKIK